MVSHRNLFFFLLLCVIWGTTWIGIKAGVDVVPPLLFAGTRFTVAGLVLIVVAVVEAGGFEVEPKDLPRLAATTFFLIAACYGPLFWGVKYIDSGTAAMLEMSLTPIALMGFALWLGEERFDASRLGAIILGVGGLALLFGPTAWQTWSAGGRDATGWRLAGAAAVSFAALTYGLGSVIARPLLRQYSSAVIAGGTTLFGGAILIGLSLLFEPGAVQALDGRWGVAAWSGWIFLVLFGSLIGYSIYMKLLRDIGATRAGTYAFVSPVIAVVLGMIFFDERVHTLDIVGMAVMLIAAGLTMRGKEQAKAATT